MLFNILQDAFDLTANASITRAQASLAVSSKFVATQARFCSAQWISIDLMLIKSECRAITDNYTLYRNAHAVLSMRGSSVHLGDGDPRPRMQTRKKSC